jgi:hypothetical protein
MIGSRGGPFMSISPSEFRQRVRAGKMCGPTAGHMLVSDIPNTALAIL